MAISNSIPMGGCSTLLRWGRRCHCRINWNSRFEKLEVLIFMLCIISLYVSTNYVLIPIRTFLEPSLTCERWASKIVVSVTPRLNTLRPLSAFLCLDTPQKVRFNLPETHKCHPQKRKAPSDTSPVPIGDSGLPSKPEYLFWLRILPVCHGLWLCQDT